MEIKKPVRLSLVEQVVTQMEELIKEGHWSVGEKIPPEMELMKQFDVSRNTLREAVRALVHMGLLETKQGSGTIVRSKCPLEVAIKRHVKKSNVLDTLEVRLALEREGARLAAERRDTKDVQRLTDCIKTCETFAHDNDIEQFINADIEFHKAVMEASHNQVLIDLYDHMTDALSTSIRDFMMMQTPLKYHKEIHYGLYEAIKEGDVDKAVNDVNHYIEDVKVKMLEKMEESSWD